MCCLPVKCDQCDGGYVDFTTRHLYQRIEEHIRSAVEKHVKELHGKSVDTLSKNFSVLRKCKSKFDCLIHEMLLIKQYKPFLRACSYVPSLVESSPEWDEPPFRR